MKKKITLYNYYYIIYGICSAYLVSNVNWIALSKKKHAFHYIDYVPSGKPINPGFDRTII